MPAAPAPAGSDDGAQPLGELAHARAVGQQQRPAARAGRGRARAGGRPARPPAGACRRWSWRPRPPTPARCRPPARARRCARGPSPGGDRPSPARCRPPRAGPSPGRRRRSRRPPPGSSCSSGSARAGGRAASTRGGAARTAGAGSRPARPAASPSSRITAAEAAGVDDARLAQHVQQLRGLLRPRAARPPAPRRAPSRRPARRTPRPPRPRGGPP